MDAQVHRYGNIFLGSSMLTALSRENVVTEIERTGVVAVIRTKNKEEVRTIVDAIIAGGVRILEITMTIPGAAELIRELSDDLGNTCILGAGTVIDKDSATQVIEAGAKFVVSPTYDPQVVALCHNHKIAVIPGCFSPTEILSAWKVGADIVKVFPAGNAGPQYLRDLKGPLPQIKLMPTGGVTIENSGTWIRAGAVAVGIGTALLDPKAIADGDYFRLTTNARQLRESIDAARA